MPRIARLVYGFGTDPIGVVTRRFETYGHTYHVDEGGGNHLLVTRDPDVIRDVLVTRAAEYRKAGGANDRLAPILGNGLLTSDGEIWKRQRRLIQPAFRQQAIADYAAIMVDHALGVRFDHGQIIDLSHEMMGLTLRIVCRALFGHDVSRHTDTVAATMDALRRVTQPQLLPAWLPTPRRRMQRHAVAEIDALIATLIAERRGSAPTTDLLSMLLQADMPDAAVRDELVTFFLAGHETTSHALTWTLLLLSEHPEIRGQVEAELDQVLADRSPTAADLGSLPTVERVIHESMRLYPPAFALPRVAAVDTHAGPFPMQPGWQIVSWVWHCHRHPDVFDRPEAFDPDRFVQPTFPSHAYLPFGAGTRKCVGARFAQMELGLLLATLMGTYRFELTGGLPAVSPAVTLAPKGAVPVRVVVRSERVR